jgi:hypothetical protein
MAVRADRIEHFIDRRTAAVLHCPAKVAAGDAAPLPIFHRQEVTVFRSAERNAFRVEVFASVLREMGVARLTWDLTSLQPTGRDRCRASVAFGHFDAFDRRVGTGEAVLYLDCRTGAPRVEMIEFIECPVWSRVRPKLASALPARLN